LRRRLVLSVAALHAVLMTGFVVELTLSQDRLLREAGVRQSEGLASALGAASVPWVLANDVEGLAEVVDALRTYPSLRYAMVLGVDLRVLAHSDRARRGEYILDPSMNDGRRASRLSSDANGNVDTMVPVLAGHRLVGWSVVSLGAERLDAARRAIVRRGLWVVALAVGVGSLLALALGRGLTKDLDRLGWAADEVRRGRPVRSGVDRPDELGRMARGFDTMLDALERQQLAERALRDELATSEQRLDRAMTAANEALWSYSPASGAVTFWARGRSGLGLPDEHSRGGAVLGHDDWQSLIHPDDLRALATALPPTRECGGEIVLDVRVKRADCEWRTFELHGRASCGADGALESIEGAVIDVTAQRVQQLQHAELKAALEQSRRLEALGRLAGGVAHDFNNMLAAVLAHTELLLPEVTEPQRADVLAIVEATQRARAVAGQVMAFSRGRAAVPHPVSVSRAVAEVARLLAPSLGAQQLQWGGPVAATCVLADRSGLVQVLMNLCGNARDAQGPAGCTVVSLESSDAPGRCVSCQQTYSGTWACLIVADQGPGIAAAALPRIFEPFFTTREGAGGHGLGLAVVHGLVHGWGGHIALSSGPSGTTFRVLLTPAEPTAVDVAASSTPPPAERRVLVVDDEPLVGRALARLLRRRGWSATLAAGVHDACRALATGTFDLVVSDYSMPDGTGLDVLRCAADAREAVPVILMTGDPSQIGSASGAFAVIAKPVDVDRLDELLRESVSRRG
jgi:signal transduction histidine kinase/CheY-like chemotaxis protein